MNGMEYPKETDDEISKPEMNNTVEDLPLDSYAQEPGPPLEDVGVDHQQVQLEDIRLDENAPRKQEQSMDNRPYIFVLLVASFWEMWSAAVYCSNLGGTDSCTGANGWAVAVGVISLVLCFVMVVITLVKNPLAESIHPFFSVIMLGWWGFGWAVCTVWEPFHTPCNVKSSAAAYIAIWIALVTSVMYTYNAQGWFRAIVSRISQASNANGTVLFGLFLSSSMLVVQSLADCNSSGHTCTDFFAWSISAGAVSAVIALVLLLSPLGAGLPAKIISGLLVLWWFLGVATITFKYTDVDLKKLGYYSSANNGFFATWISMILSVCVCYLSWGNESLQMDLMDARLHLMLLSVASLFTIWSSGAYCDTHGRTCTDQLKWLIALGIISSCVCLLLGLVYCFLGHNKDHCIHKVSPVFAALLFLLWLAGVVVGTFDQPFTSMCDETANGYISLWLGFLAASTFLYTSFSLCRDTAAKSAEFIYASAVGLPGYGVLLASIVVLMQAAFECGDVCFHPQYCYKPGSWHNPWNPAANCTMPGTVVPPVPISTAVSKQMTFNALSIADWSGDTKHVYEWGFGIGIGIYDVSAKAYKPGCSVTSTASRRAISVAFTAQVSAALATAATQAATTLTAAEMANSIQSANTALNKTVAVPNATDIAVLTPPPPLPPAPSTVPTASNSSNATGANSTRRNTVAAPPPPCLPPGIVAVVATESAVGNFTDILTILDNLDLEKSCSSMEAWAVSAGAVSIVVCCVLLCIKQVEAFAKFISIFLVLWWFAALASLTFVYRDVVDDMSVHNFFTPANGFFGTWAAFFLSAILAGTSWLGKERYAQGETQSGQDDYAPEGGINDYGEDAYSKQPL